MIDTGIISAYPQESKQALGVAPDSEIYFVDIGSDEDDTVSVGSLINGVNWAIENKVDIINISI